MSNSTGLATLEERHKRALIAVIDIKIAKLSDKVCSVGISERDADAARGGIAELKKMAKAIDPDTPQVVREKGLHDIGAGF